MILCDHSGGNLIGISNERSIPVFVEHFAVSNRNKYLSLICFTVIYIKGLFVVFNKKIKLFS